MPKPGARWRLWRSGPIQAELLGTRKERTNLATKQIVDDLDALIEVLPDRVQRSLRARDDVGDLVEVVLDLGRVPEARFPHTKVTIGDDEVTDADMEFVVSRVGRFGDDNRAGIERTLHRISVIRNRAGRPVGLTCRVGRAVFGTIRVIRDLVMTGESLLLLGRPGVGKTTMLREVARVLADDGGRRVVIVDTSNEIAGDGDVPHPAIGPARRMQVPRTDLQHRLMIEAVENHMPEVIIIDEMSTELEALAARTIAERGVQLVATAHGNTLANVVSNPTLSDLVGGTQSVTLGDIEARRRRTQKTILERRHEPTFDIVVEIRDRNRVAVHRDSGQVVDSMLRGYPTPQEVRWLGEDGEVKSALEDPSESPGPTDLAPAPWPDHPFARSPREVELLPKVEAPASRPAPPTRVHPFGIPRPTLQEAIDEMAVPVRVVASVEEADVLVTTKAHYGRRPRAVRDAEKEGTPVHVLRRGSGEQIRQFLRRFRNGGRNDARGTQDEDTMTEALAEAEEGLRRVLSGERRIALSPQSAYVRRLQHGLASRYNLGSSSTGHEPNRYVVIRARRRNR